MSDLETANIPIMEPMVLDNSRFLDAAEQWAVARWALKTAMLLDSATVAPERPMFYSREECVSLRQSQTIPRGTLVWLGRSLDTGFVAQSSGVWFSMSAPGSKPINTSEELILGHVTTILIGHLALQVFTMRVPAEHGYGTISVNAGEGPWDELLTGIWPPCRNAYWPPLLAFTEGIPRLHLDRLRSRWRYGTERKIF